MGKWFIKILLMGTILIVLGCGHTAYLGMHGRSIRLYPDVHESMEKDSQCLECHDSGSTDAPVSPHPDFTGCIKCHND
jgi:hypothetical protein